MDRYEIEIKLNRDMLGTNPSDTQILDTHIIERQRKLIADNSKINKDINKYLDQIPISDTKKNAEIGKHLDKLEEMTGYKFTDEQRDLALTGQLDALKETFAELDQKGVTVFFWDKDKKLPCIGDHMIYGFMKAAGEAISKTKTKKNGTVLQSAAYTHSIINQHVRIPNEFITFDTDIKRFEDGSPAYLQRSLRAKTAMGDRVALAKSEVVPAGAKLKFVLQVMPNSPLKKEHIEEIFDYGSMTGLGQWRNSGKGSFEYKLKQL